MPTKTVELVHDIDEMTDTNQVKQLAQRMFNALNASQQRASHFHHVFGGWIDCPPCEKANAECDGVYACDQMKDWQKVIDAARVS